MTTCSCCTSVGTANSTERRLHLCMHDTETTDLLATAVSSTRINEFVEASRARSVAIVLDCCYAGAFRGADLGDAVSGPGRYVLTSCRGTQLATTRPTTMAPATSPNISLTG